MSKADQLYNIIRFIRPLYLNLSNAVEKELEGTGISVAKRAVLEIISDCGPQTVPNIGRIMSVQRQYIQGMVNELEDDGLVGKAPNAAHKRSVLIQITAKGSKAIKAVRDKEQLNLAKVAKGLTQEQIESAQAVINHLNEFFSMNQNGG